MDEDYTPFDQFADILLDQDKRLTHEQRTIAQERLRVIAEDIRLRKLAI